MYNFKRVLIIGIVYLLSSTASQAQNWYFDKDSLGGTCNNKGPGTLTQPFCDIFKKFWNDEFNPQAGDTIFIRKGTYIGRIFWIKNTALKNGTPANPITIKAYPGETVVFDGLGTTDFLIKLYGPTHDLHFIGPFEAKNYSYTLDGDVVTSLRTNLVFDGWTIHDGSMGFLLRYVGNTIVRNCTFYNLKGSTGSIADNVIGVSIRGNATLHSNNVTIENSIAHDINDGKGNDNGDADGFHTDQYCDNVKFKNLAAYRCSEDGVDTKANMVTMENIVSYQNGATGIKMWGGGQGKANKYTTSNLLTFGNTETGVKCTGNGDKVIAVIDNMTSWGNGQENLKNTTGGDASDGCSLTVRNSILGQGGINTILFPAPKPQHTTSLNLDLVNINHTSSSIAINPGRCPNLTGKFTLLQYTDGSFNADLEGGVDCVGYGTMSGRTVNPSSFDPKLVDAPVVFEWASIAENAISSSMLTLVTEASYPWPSPSVGHYIEINDDGVKRQITGIGNSTNRTIEFSPAVAFKVCGRATDCRGTRVTGWSSGTTYKNDLRLSAESPAHNVGIWIRGVHCALADDKGGKDLTGCIHWLGCAPDLGYVTPPTPE